MGRKNILIVDDDKVILQSLKNILESEGYGVYTAETGQEAIRLVKENAFNLALLDTKLPDMEGTELLTTMLSISPQMMKIMLTGYPSLENAVKSLNLKANAYLMKPVTPEKLLKAVKEKIGEQEDAERMSEEKVTDWIWTRIRKLKQENRSR